MGEGIELKYWNFTLRLLVISRVYIWRWNSFGQAKIQYERFCKLFGVIAKQGRLFADEVSDTL